MKWFFFSIFGILFTTLSCVLVNKQLKNVPPASPMQTWHMLKVDWADIPQPADNPLTPARVKLGAMLFFDPRLSKSNTISCASCHQSDKGYSDGRPFFKGENGVIGTRTSPTVTNLAWNYRFFWDGRAASLEEQSLGPIQSHSEMGAQSMDSLVLKLEKANYLPYFQKAFGREAEITPSAIAKALAGFERTLVSHDAPFDRYMAGDPTAMTASQIRGKRVFETKGKCIECHRGKNFTDDGFHNLGVTLTDSGRYKILPLPSMKYAFKTPGLRDVEYRAPYFHNGSAATLMAVVELYNQGGLAEARATQTNIAITPLNLTAQEKQDLVHFMKALTGKGAHNFPRPTLPDEQVSRQ